MIPRRQLFALLLAACNLKGALAHRLFRRFAQSKLFLSNPLSEQQFASDIQEQFAFNPALLSRGGASSGGDDFGTYLSQVYCVEDGRDTEEATITPIMGGAFQGALQKARASARLLVVFIPSTGPKGKRKADLKAIESVLSSKVAKAAEKKARKKGETASFAIWGTDAKSTEATQAMKRLKVKATNAKGEKRPILLVLYPAQVVTKSGLPKIVPKVVAQHHCNPPPTPEEMAQWMNELRKRYSKQYAKMQIELKEAQLFKERKEGYKESVQSDIERKIREKKEEAERLAKEKAEQERQEALKKRRKELAASLPEEPDADVEGIFTLALRFPDGRSGKRRFAPDTKLSVVFDWVDAAFSIERELVVLTTMNGKQTFTWDDDDTQQKNISEGGFGRMTGFRVAEKQAEAENADVMKEEKAYSEDDGDEL